jgi:CheY-like chemotaxis protein
VVDDDDHMRGLLRAVVEHEGHEVVAPGSATEALERLGREPSNCS